MSIDRSHGVLAEQSERDGGGECLAVARRLFPDPRQAEIALAGGAARYIGPDSPLNEAICIGIEAPVTDDDIERITAFYTERDAPARVMASPLADASLGRRLVAHGYAPVDDQNLLIGDVRTMEGAYDPNIRVAADNRAWADAAIEAYASGEAVEPDAYILGMIIAEVSTVTVFEAVIDGRIASVGAIGTNPLIGGMFFGSTMPWARGRGLQLAMVKHRIRALQDVGAGYVRAAAGVATSSERNFRRAGFHIAYTRTTWERPLPEPRSSG